MILVDFNQVMIIGVTGGKNAKIDRYTMDEMRIIFIEQLRQINRNYRSVYGPMVLCCDAKTSWRKDYFPFYKAGRKAQRESSNIDWPWIMSGIDTFREELEAEFPYRTILVDKAEGDDVISVLARSSDDRHVIYSSDGDFGQLHRDNIEQFSPYHKQFIRISDPVLFLKEKIIRGDSGDGIPNILSEDNIFLIPDKRQKRITSKRLENWLPEEPSTFCETPTMLRNWERNKLLIDLSQIPENIQQSILHKYEETKPKRRDNLINYFMKNEGTAQFIKDLQDF